MARQARQAAVEVAGGVVVAAAALVGHSAVEPEGPGEAEHSCTGQQALEEVGRRRLVPLQPSCLLE